MYVKIASARVSTVYNNGAASANSSYNAGFAYDTTGKLQVDTASVPATSSYNNGIARHSDGVVCINTHDPSLIPYAYLPQVNENYFSTPDSVANSITGAISIAARVALDDWTPAEANSLITKWYSTGNQLAYEFLVATDGTLSFATSSTGADVVVNSSSTAATGIADGSAYWVMVTYSGTSLKFYTAPDSSSLPTAWVQLGTTVTVTAGSMFDSSAAVEVGTAELGTTRRLKGKFYRGAIWSGAVVSDGTGGTLALDFNADDWIETSTNGATQASSTTGEVWTLNNTGTNLAGIWGVARGHGGIFTDNSGALYVNVADAVTGAIGGIPITAKGAVAVSAVT